MRKLMMLFAMLALIAGNAYAQERVTGQVLSAEDEEPLVGATVKVQGHPNIATATDLDGNFTLNNVPKSAKNLEVSYIGYTTKTVKISPNIKVYLETYSETMDEVIVVAFGKQKREAFTGSASVVDSKQIEKMTVNNPIEALNGNVTGMNMTESNSLTGEPNMTVRGIGSLNAGTQPLIVVDGLPYSGQFNDINPSEVASITVLKDAASNALYGARGANGVILITSKAAQRGKTVVTAEAKWGVNTNGRVNYDVIDTPAEYYEAQYLQLYNYLTNSQGNSPEEAHLTANTNMGLSGVPGGLGYMVYDVPSGENLILENGRINPNATLGNRLAYGDRIYLLLPDNWEKIGMRNGFRQEYNLNINGGNEKSTFLGNISFLKNDGLSYGESIKRFNARLKADYQAYEWLRVGGSAKYSKYNSKQEANIYGLYSSVAPIYPLYIRDGNGNIMQDPRGDRYDYGEGDNAGCLRSPFSAQNPVQQDLLNIYNNSSNAFQFQGYATLDLPAGFQLTVNGSTYLTENRWNSAENPYYGFSSTFGGYVFVGQYRTQDFNYQQLLQWNRSFGNNNFDVLVGHEYSYNVSANLEASKDQVASYEYNTELDGAVINGDITSYKSEYNVEGYFVRAQYDYDNRIFASASFRRDGSSIFSPKHRWGNFWSLGAAWILNKEEWWPQNRYVNMLKAKISYGEQGNDNIGYWRYFDHYSINNVNDKVGYTFSSKGNETITWETVGSLNTGIEFEFFDSRLSGGLEYYIRNTRDMLMKFTVPNSLGYSSYYDNIGDMRNTGVELQLNANIIQTKNVGWDLGMNLTWEKNRVTYLPEEKRGTSCEGYNGYTDDTLFIAEGLPVRTWRMKRYAGVDPETGKSLFYKNVTDKETGETTLTTTEYIDNASYYLCGSALPDVFGGINTSLRVYGFDFSTQVNYSIGGVKNDGQYYNLMRPATTNSSGSGIHRDIWKAWSKENPTSEIPIWQLGDNVQYSDRWLTNASFVGIRNATLGYTFPKKVTSVLKMSKLRVYATCDNIYYWSHRKGFDPRTGILSGNVETLSDGSNGGYNYPMRTFTGGIQISF